jgi:hypothetical protein
MKHFHLTFTLKGPYHEIFDPRFSHQSNPPRPLTNGLKQFRIWLCIRRDIRKTMNHHNQIK